MINKKVVEIAAMLQGMPKNDIQTILDEVSNELSLSDQPKVVDQILIDTTNSTEDGGTCCGMKYCPFHRWAKVTNPWGAVDSICELPGDGGNVLDYYPHEDKSRLIICALNGHVVSRQVKRLPKCLKLKPPQ